MRSYLRGFPWTLVLTASVAGCSSSSGGGTPSANDASAPPVDSGSEDSGPAAVDAAPDGGDATALLLDGSSPEAGVDGAALTDASDAGDGGSACSDASTLCTGLVSWWPAEGNANDIIGPNNGTIQGGVTFVAGKIGQAFEFDGTTGDVAIPTSTTLDVTTGQTVAFWIKVAAWPAQLTLITEKWDSTGENKHTYITPTGNIGFNNVNASAANLVSATALTLNTWHHVAVTYDGTNEDVYIDGSFDASEGAAGAVGNGTGPLSFAHNAPLAAANSTYNTYFAGDLDEIRWYSRALSGAEISLLASGASY
jgi:hypothetical protein